MVIESMQNIKKKGAVIEEKDTIFTPKKWWINSSNDLSIILKEGQRWYDSSDYKAVKDNKFYKVDKNSYTEILESVPKLYSKEVAKYQRSKNEKDGDRKWISGVIDSGTLTDKIAALALLVQESPAHQLAALDKLIEMANHKTQQRTSQAALEALKDLLKHNLLPEKGKLLPFGKITNFGHPKMTLTAVLLQWFEGQLILRVNSIVDAVEFALKHSTIDHYKKICLQIAGELVNHSEEGRIRLISNIVHRLCDSSPIIASKAAEIVKFNTKNNSEVKLLFIKEMKSRMFQSNTSVKGLFAIAACMTQIRLLPRVDVTAAEELIDGFVGLFERVISNDELGSRLLAILLNGINSAYNCISSSSLSSNVLMKHVDSLYRVIHDSSFASSTQALLLLSNAVLSSKPKPKSDSNNKETDEDAFENRFYRALYGQLLCDQVSSRSKNVVFLNVLFRSLKKDTSIDRVKSFCKRIMMIALQASPGIAAGLMLLISEICKIDPKKFDMLKSLTCSPIVCGDKESSEEDKNHFFDEYDAMKREPKFSVKPSADNNVSLWELSLLQNHYHPSVTAFAKSLVSNTDSDGPAHEIIFHGDPTEEFSMGQFLNRFTYKNPKKRDNPAKAEDPINKTLEDMIASGKEALVAPDKAFFYRFFGNQAKLQAEGKSRAKPKPKKVLDDDELSDEMDEYADKLANDMLRANNPDIDDEFDDLDDAPSSSDGEFEGDFDGSDNESDVEGDDFNMDYDDDSGADEFIEEEGCLPTFSKHSTSSKSLKASSDPLSDMSMFAERENSDDENADDDQNDEDEEPETFRKVRKFSGKRGKMRMTGKNKKIRR